MLSFYLAKGHVDDRNIKLMTSMTQGISGKLFGDKGYILKVPAELSCGNRIQMVTKPSKNMKGFNISQTDKVLLRKRALFEYVNDELT